jgi:hypothetical protein
MSKTGLHSIAEVSNMIENGRVLLLAGDEKLLSKLPAGKWIGGTSVNFVADEGGTTERDRIFVTDITEHADEAIIRRYSADTLGSLASDYSEHGFSVIIVPGLSDIHAAFAKEIQSVEGVFNTPLIGWISGVHLSEIGTRIPKCFAGTGAPITTEAVAMHVTLPAGQNALIDIINLFKQGNGEVITFDADGFVSEGKCHIGGVPASLAAYIADRKLDTKLPLVADYNGAMINVSIQSVDTAGDKVQFYAPVFKGIKYRFADPVLDYAGVFASDVQRKDASKIAFSCNCILNYAYAELEGKKTGSFVGPVTFGEVAYMLLNQTLAYISIEQAA